MKNGVVGIDFGTTNAYGTVIINGDLKMIYMPWGSRYNLDGKLDIKRFIGRTYSDDLVQQICKKHPFEIVNKNGDIRFKIKLNNEECYKGPEDFCSEILKNFNTRTKAVLTVPAYFTIRQRQAMMEAAKLAQMNVICLLEEPIAAFIGHLDQVKDTNGLSMVFHLGGGTFDITILEYSDCKIVVKCIDGDYMFGGNDFDEAMIDYFIKDKKICDKTGFKEWCERIKRDISHKTEVGKTYFYTYLNNIPLEISKKKFEEITDPLCKRCMDIVKRCLTKNNINKSDIKNIIMVGGSTKIPKIKELVSNFFESSKIVQAISPEETVAIGAALYGHVYNTPFAKKLVTTTSNNF